jgi:hypothetical protein
MKKLSLAVAVAGALSASAANAAVISEFGNGVIVPYAYFDATENTVAGFNSSCAGTVFWIFFDVDTKHILDDEFPMTADDQESFIWSEDVAGQGVDGLTGYLNFVFDSNGNTNLDVGDQPCLAASALQVVLGQDVAFLPALPLYTKNPDAGLNGGNTGGDFGAADANGVYQIDPETLLDEDGVINLSAGANHGDVIYMRYFLDGGASTTIFFWSAQDISGTYTVQMYNTDQDRRSVNFVLPNAELNAIDPSTIVGKPADYVDGFIKWDLSAPNYPFGLDLDGVGRLYRDGTNNGVSYGDGIVTFSFIDAPAFNALQTIMNPVQLRESPDDNGNGVAVENQVRVRTTVAPQP